MTLPPSSRMAELSIDELLQGYSPAVQALARGACDLVASVLPGATVKVHPGWKNIIFGTGPRMKDMVIAVVPHSTRVNLQFFAVGIPDPEGLLDGTGKAGRHIKISTQERVQSSAVREILLAVVAAKATPPADRPLPEPSEYRAYASKTVAAPVETLFTAWVEDEPRRRWLGDEPLVIRGTTRGKSLRARWGGMPLDVRFEAKGDAKSSVAVDHRGIATEAEAAELKARWKEALGRLAAVVQGSE